MDTGECVFETIKPGRVPFPDGRLMAPHITFWIVARGINIGLHTRMYFGDEEAANAEDPVLARIEHRVRVPTLIAPRDGERLHASTSICRARGKPSSSTSDRRHVPSRPSIIRCSPACSATRRSRAASRVEAEIAAMLAFERALAEAEAAEGVIAGRGRSAIAAALARFRPDIAALQAGRGARRRRRAGTRPAAARGDRRAACATSAFRRDQPGRDRHRLVLRLKPVLDLLRRSGWPN